MNNKDRLSCTAQPYRGNAANNAVTPSLCQTSGCRTQYVCIPDKVNNLTAERLLTLRP